MNQAFIVVGMGYGDEGKGSWVDHLVRKHDIKYVVRFNGGAQASHHVVTPGGVTHAFQQFGSGSFTAGAETCLSRFMLVEPEQLLNEAKALERKGVAKPLDGMIVSENAPIITPCNRLLNHIQEIKRGASRHGSCGYGIGITQNDVETLGSKALYARDLSDAKLQKKLFTLWERRLDEARPFVTEDNAHLFEKLEGIDLGYYAQLFRHVACRVRIVPDEEIATIIRENDVVFEGAQGVLLDQVHGFYPYCTRSNCTFRNADTLLHEAKFGGNTQRVGLLRAYGTRHGAGPFVTEDTSSSIAPCHNQANVWQGSFRLGWFDAVAARYALRVVERVDTLAITNLDRLTGLPEIKIADRYNNADSRYFQDGEPMILEFDKARLTERSNLLRQVTAHYINQPGWCRNGDGAQMDYLDQIADLIKQPIDAYSISAEHCKHYRSRL